MDVHKQFPAARDAALKAWNETGKPHVAMWHNEPPRGWVVVPFTPGMGVAELMKESEASDGG